MKEKIYEKITKTNRWLISISEKGNLVLSKGTNFTWYNKQELEASKKKAKQSIAISYKKGGNNYDGYRIWCNFSRKLRTGKLPGGKKLISWDSIIVTQDGTLYTIRRNKLRKVAYKKADSWQHRYEILNILGFLYECSLYAEHKAKLFNWLMIIITKYVTRQLPLFNIAFDYVGEERFNKALEYLMIYKEIAFIDISSYKKQIGSFNSLCQHGYNIWRNFHVFDNLGIKDKNCLNKLIIWSVAEYNLIKFRAYDTDIHKFYSEWLRLKYAGTNVNVDVLLTNRLLKNNYNSDCFEGLHSIMEYSDDPRVAALIPNNLHKLDFKELEEQTNLIHRDIKRVIENMPFNIPDVEKYSIMVDDYQFKIAEDSATLGWLGNVCHNCVGGYSHKVRRGDAIILYGQNKNNTICIEIDPKTNKVMQCLNPYNKRVATDDLKKCLTYFKALGISHNGWCVEKTVVKEDVFDRITGELIDLGRTVYIDLETGKEVNGRASYWYVND